MSISLLLDMVEQGDPERIAVVSGSLRVTAAALGAMTRGAAGLIGSAESDHVVYIGTGGIMVPLLLFGSAKAGRAFTPLNYRLSPAALHELVDRLRAPLIIADSAYAEALRESGRPVLDSDLFLAATRTASSPDSIVDAIPDNVAVVLFTSGTTSRPKAVELTHANLTSYVMGTVDFASADPGDAALICVPPYHIAGVGASLTNLYAGRKMVYLRQFEPKRWIELVNREKITNATVVPTMLDRIITEFDSAPVELPSLRTLAYGGSKAPLPLVRAALERFPHVGLVNAYGLTETSSTITVLTPEDHRIAVESSDPAVAKRLSSVGRAVPGIELEIRDEDGKVAEAGETGELFVRGPQVSGVYADVGSALDEDGWFPTRDLAALDDQGYLYLGGRGDDTIIRGGENIAPAEIEDVLIEHPDIREVAVIGLPDAEWGQIIVAVVVPAPGRAPGPDVVRDYARANLRGSRTPDRVVFAKELPTTPTGKVLRRNLVDELTPSEPAIEEVS